MSSTDANKGDDEWKGTVERVHSLLLDTVTLLCKNSIQFEKQLKVEYEYFPKCEYCSK